MGIFFFFFRLLLLLLRLLLRLLPLPLPSSLLLLLRFLHMLFQSVPTRYLSTYKRVTCQALGQIFPRVGRHHHLGILWIETTAPHSEMKRLEDIVGIVCCLLLVQRNECLEQNRNPIRKDVRDVEEIDPGLLQNNFTITGRTVSPLGKQFTNIPNSGSGFSSSNFIPGQTGSFGPVQGSTFPGINNPSNSFPGTGNIPGQGSFLPGQGIPGQGIPGSGIPGQGIPGSGLPGQFPSGQGALLPPGSVSQDSVAFSATRASDFTRTAVTQVRFDQTITDIGYGWYPDRSEFICYYPGVYYFTFSGLSPQTRQFKLTLIRNNQEIVSAWGESSGYQMGTNSAVLTLNQNDRVYLVLQEGSLHESNLFGRGYTTFSGFRVR